MLSRPRQHQSSRGPSTEPIFLTSATRPNHRQETRPGSARAQLRGGNVANWRRCMALSAEMALTQKHFAVLRRYQRSQR